jgi:hypothetical protein
MSKERRASQSRVDPGPFIVAMTLAEEMAGAIEANIAQREELLAAALMVGQWLADQGRAGRWDTIDAAALLRAMALPDRTEESGFLLTVTGLLGFAAFRDYLPIAPVRRTLADIQRLVNDPAVAAFVAQTTAQIEAVAAP